MYVTTTDRNMQEIFKVVGLGKPTTNNIQHNVQKNIVKGSTILTDSIKVYDQLADQTGCRIVNLKTHAAYNAVEHLNTVNSIHSFIKRLHRKMRTVSSKCLNRYLSLFVFLRRFQDMDDNEKLPIIIRKLKSFHFTITRHFLKTSFLVEI